MLVALFPTLCLVTVIHAQLCRPDAENAFKVRLSLKTALGDKAYAWNRNEEYLFKAMVAFSLRTLSNRETIEMNRNRINNAFFLNDQTLEFLEIPTTFGPPTEPSTPTWIITFGAVFFIVAVGIVLLIISGIHKRRRKSKASRETGDVEDKHETMVTIENGIPCDTLDSKEGRINRAFPADDEKFTPL
ncbi:collectrin isoform X2 [Phascolarctos cinereus]|uniref:Collectrin isoform X2 n=1 Tax=Phascolarctos cinereus TaxID=38626 RepID=A0A6P5LXC4_PHACI|nr:collectrin isoform X2 [Phascolarctos cinereus]